jgi:hypothetical protein
MCNVFVNLVRIFSVIPLHFDCSNLVLFRVIAGRECAEEKAEIERREREEAEHAECIIAAQSRAFDLTRAGKGVETCQLIDKFGLDVTKPQKLNLNGNQKDRKEKPGNDLFETMLHVAAGYCDVQAVRFLLEKGTDLFNYHGYD